MYKKIKPSKTTLIINQSLEGETIEKKIRRIVNNKEPIKDGAPIIYTERKDGVRPEYDIRTDRFEIATEATDYISRSNKAKREANIAARAKKGMEEEAKTEKTIGGTEPLQGTDKQ